MCIACRHTFKGNSEETFPAHCLPPPPPNHPTFHYKKLGGNQGIGLDHKQELWYDKEQLTFLTDFWEAESGWTLQVNIVWVRQSAQALQLILTQVLVPSTLVWWDREIYPSTLSLLVHTIQAVSHTISTSHTPLKREKGSSFCLSVRDMACTRSWFRLFIISGKRLLPHDCPSRPSRSSLMPRPLSYILTLPVALEAYHDWSGEAAGARLRVNFTLNYCWVRTSATSP